MALMFSESGDVELVAVVVVIGVALVDLVGQGDVDALPQVGPLDGVDAVLGAAGVRGGISARWSQRGPRHQWIDVKVGSGKYTATSLSAYVLESDWLEKSLGGTHM